MAVGGRGAVATLLSTYANQPWLFGGAAFWEIGPSPIFFGNAPVLRETQMNKPPPSCANSSMRLYPVPVRAGVSVVVSVSAGETIESMVDRGMAASANTEEAAKASRIGTTTFRKARYVVLLARKPGLSPSEVLMAEYALREMNQSQRTEGPYQTVRPIVERIWGENLGTKGLDQTENRRLAEFDRAIATLCEVTRLIDEIPIPATGEKITETLQLMKRAQRQLRSFTSKLEKLEWKT